MSRYRMIKPEFWEDTKLASLGSMSRLFFIATWNFADDEGYLENDPKWLKAKALPYDDIDIPDLIKEIEEIGRFEIKNGIIKIVNFTKHQKINRPTPSELKPKFEAKNEDSVSDHGAFSEHSVSDHGGLTRPYLKTKQNKLIKETTTHSHVAKQKKENGVVVSSNIFLELESRCIYEGELRKKLKQGIDTPTDWGRGKAQRLRDSRRNLVEEKKAVDLKIQELENKISKSNEKRESQEAEEKEKIERESQVKKIRGEINKLDFDLREELRKKAQKRAERQCIGVKPSKLIVQKIEIDIYLEDFSDTGSPICHAL